MSERIMVLVKQHPGWSMYGGGGALLSTAMLIQHGLSGALTIAGVAMIVGAVVYGITKD
jgi:hypothetical protein